jgi:hypothetical protein
MNGESARNAASGGAGISMRIVATIGAERFMGAGLAPSVAPPISGDRSGGTLETITPAAPASTEGDTGSQLIMKAAVSETRCRRR